MNPNPLMPLIDEADKALWTRHPELNGRKLTRADQDRPLREEWNDLFAKYALTAVAKLRDEEQGSV